MGPIRITATLDSPIALPTGPLALDGLVMWAAAQRLDLAPLGFRDAVDVEIPIAKSACGRVYLASSSIVDWWELHERRFVNRRFPVAEAQVFGEPRFKRINLSAGAQKMYRIPTAVALPEHDTLAWFCVGDREALVDLLTCVTHLGKRRAVGRGKVRAWTVETCEPWSDGFPVVREGRALRTLPAEWPGLVDPVLAHEVISPPYWQRERAETCAVPEQAGA